MLFRVNFWGAILLIAGVVLASSQWARAQTHPASSTAPAVDPIAARLIDAKAEQKSAIARAKETLVKAIDTRLNSAADAGDLSKVETLQAAKTSARRDGTVPSDTTDASVLSAKKTYDAAVRSADEHLATAYKTAVHDYTKARQFSDAEAAENEFKASGLSAALSASTDPPAQGGSASASGSEARLKAGPWLTLNRSLPSFLIGSRFSAVPSGGLLLESAIGTRSADLLTKDFVFDVEVKLADHGDPIFIGLGNDVGGGRPGRQTSIKMSPPENGHGGATMTNNDEWGERNDLGSISEPGLYIVRVEKIGRSVIYSVGTEENKQFKPMYTRGVVDIRKFNEDLQDKSTHLYFCGGKNDIFTRTRLITGETTGPALSSAAALPFGSFPMERTVPAIMTGGAYNVTPEGVAPFHHNFESASHAFLSSDYTCDVTFDVHKDRTAFVGLGLAGTAKYLALDMRPDKEGMSIALNHNEQWPHSFSSIPEPGTYVARIDKLGRTVTFSVGTGEGADFKPIASKTVGDIGTDADELTPVSTHLILGGDASYSKITISPPIGEGAPTPSAPPSANGGGKAQPSDPGEPRILGNGSGFFIAPDGYILTDKHVAAAGDYLLVRLPDNSLRLAERIVLDDEQDMAVIKIKTTAPVPFIRLAGYEHPAMGADVAVFGFPIQAVFGLKASVKMTRGIVTAWDGDNKLCDVTVDAAVNPGSSGGPMVDRRGNLLALTAMKTVALDGEVSLSSYGLGYSTGRIRKFFKKQHDKLAAANLTDGSDKATELSNEELATRLTPCTVCILVGKGTPPDLGGLAAAPTPEPVPSPQKNPASPAGNKPFEPRKVDLLELVNAKRDAAKGNWRLNDHTLQASKENGAQLSFQYCPPLEYDLNVDLNKDEDGSGTLVMFPHDRKMLFLSMQGVGGTGTHFGKLPDSLLNKANTSFHVQRNKVHVVHVEVRPDRLKAYIDDKLWLNYKTDYSEFLGQDDDKGLITLIDWYSNIRYSKVEVIERSGPGTYYPRGGQPTQEIPDKAVHAMPADPAASQAPAAPQAVPLPAPAPAAAAEKLSFSGYYCIINKASGDRLWVASGKGQGNSIFCKAASNSDNEHWSLNTITGFDGVKIVNKHTNRTISVRSGKSDPGTDTIQWNEWKAGETYSKPADDNWKIEKVGDHYKLINELAGLALTQAVEKDKRAVEQPWKGGDDQLWQIQQVK